MKGKKLEKGVELGSELDFNLKIEDMKAIIELHHDGSLGFATVQVGVELVKLVNALTDLIPGEIDDWILDKWMESLKKKKTNP